MSDHRRDLAQYIGSQASVVHIHNTHSHVGYEMLRVKYIYIYLYTVCDSRLWKVQAGGLFRFIFETSTVLPYHDENKISSQNQTYGNRVKQQASTVYNAIYYNTYIIVIVYVIIYDNSRK